MTLSANVSPLKEFAPASSGTIADRSVYANPTTMKSAAGTDSPPLQRRLQANRDNARKSTGPKTAEGKARSRNNAIRHGLTSRIALPRETVVEIADHFWRLVQSFRPEDAVTVNAILELTFCSWKFRRLFEQYASNQARSRLTVNDERKAREIRLAQRWFRKLSEDPRKALAHLRRSTTGLSLIVDCFDNLIAELNQPEGSWTSRQFLLAVNLGGFDDFEVWDNVHLRSIWSAWFACRPGRKATPEDFNSILPAYPEYRNRAKKAIETAPLAADGRRQLIEWVQSLRDEAVRRREVQEQVEDDLETLQPMAAGWPAPEETSQHMLYLRYSNQVDRKMRELHALIEARTTAFSGDSWMFDEELLPSDWKAVLLQHRTMRNVSDGIDKGEITEMMAESLMKENLFELGSMNSHRNLEKSPRCETRNDASPTNPGEPPESIAPQPDPVSQVPASAATSTNPEIDNGIRLNGPNDDAETARPTDSQANPDRSLPTLIDSHQAAEAETCEKSRTPSQPEPNVEPGVPSRASAPPRANHRRLRPDKAADVRKDRHRHAGKKPVRPPETRFS